MYDIGKMPKTIDLGYIGENKFRTIEIDMTKWMQKMPDGVASIVCILPGQTKADAYIADTTFDTETNVLTWQITAGDLGTIEGDGEMQIWLEEEENNSISKRGKSTRVKTKVYDAASDPTETVPAAQEAWLESMTALKTATVNAAGTASSAKDDAVLAKQAAEAAQTAAEAATVHQPTVGVNGNWYVWNQTAGEYQDTQIPASGDPTILINDSSTANNRAWSAYKVDNELNTVMSALPSISPKSYGAKGDGVTDDSAAIQAAVDAGYEIYLNDNKTYYLASPVTIDHDIHIFGGKNTTIKTKTPSGGTVNNAFEVTGTLKKTTTLTTDYSSVGSTANSGNKFTLTDMDGISIGDLLVIKATDQYYSYARDTYYLGAALLVADIYDGHIYTPINMPFDIENTENVTVEVYSAPTAIFEELSFVSDLDSRGNYKFFIKLNHAKNSIIKNCDMSQMDNGIWASECFNTLIENVSVSKSKYDNTLLHDGYGIYVYSCTNTVIRRITSICSQGCIDLGGTIPNIDTFIYNCMVGSECRSIGIDMHENSYNIVIEDCTLGGISLFGTAKVNRCKIINNMRAGAYNCYINLRGSHNPAFAEYVITNCLFDGTGILMDKPYVQSPVQTFDNVFGNVEVENCVGGSLVFNPVVDATVLSSKAKQILIKNWRNCAKIHHTNGNVIEYLEIIDTPFVDQVFITGETTADKFYMDNIKRLVYKVNKTNIDKLFVDEQTHGMKVLLPKDVSIQLSSANAYAKFIVCGENITPGSADDYIVGTVSGSVGNDLNRTAASASYENCVSIDENGDPVFTQPNLSGQYSFYPVGMLYINEPSKIAMSATLKNTGETDGASWYPYIVILNGETGKIKYRGSGTVKQASAGGNAISHERDADKGDLVMCYFYCATVVKNSVSTFEDLVFTCTPYFIKPVASEAAYTAKRMTGDGTIKSFEGINNIMCSELTFNVKFGADYVNNPIGL